MALTDNLISAWELDEASGSAVDSAGTNTLTDNNGVGNGTGLVHTLARSFAAASNQYFSHADNADLSVGNIDWTFEAWHKPTTATGGSKRLVAKGGSNDLEYSLELGNGQFDLRVTSGPGFANDTTVTSALSVSAGNWYQVIGWHNTAGNSISIAVNNGTPDVVAFSAGTYDGGGTFQLGSFPFYGGLLDGLMGPVRFWKRMLTSGERTTLYNGGAGLAYSAFGGGGVLTAAQYYHLLAGGQRVP